MRWMPLHGAKRSVWHESVLNTQNLSGCFFSHSIMWSCDKIIDVDDADGCQLAFLELMLTLIYKTL
uniref:Uncharacterized protein n=1 Tax=Megaselia scalaris TaxID=36166 RepID=T1GVL3_MEGSC